MTPLATLVLIGFGLGIAVVVWRLTTLQTDQAGFVRIRTYRTMVEARYTMDILIREGVRVSLDSHGTGRIFLLVDESQQTEAHRILEKYAGLFEADEPLA
jgi:hypothetical protein